ncbi:MAG: hypothetical protein WKF43_15035 [Acidimicrobiales bacterium]
MRSDNVWVLIPLAAISIPILAVLDDSPLGWFIGIIALVGARTLAARNLLQFRQRLRLEELAAQERLSIAERERFLAVDWSSTTAPTTSVPRARPGLAERRQPRRASNLSWLSLTYGNNHNRFRR